MLALLLSLSSSAFAELPNIRLDRIQPLGASAGSSTEIEIVGNDIDDVKSLWISHPGISASPVEKKERRFLIKVADDVPAGTYDVRAVGRWGASNPRLFAVTRGLVDVEEKEPNQEPAQAQPVSINSAVNGVSDGNNDDFFRVALKAGQRIVIDCQSGKLDTMMDANLAVMSLDGKQLASSSDYNGRDPLIAFTAPTSGGDGDYLIRVFDLSYRGGFPYRLLITDKPYVTSLSPRAVQAGQSAELSALGHNLGGKASKASIADGDISFEELKFGFTAPADALSHGGFRYFEHPTDHSPLPTAATCTLTGFQVRPPVDDALSATTLVLTDSPVTLEAEPNDAADKPQKVALPLAISGRFDGPRDADWYEFDVPDAGGSYLFNVYCERIRGYADPYVVVVDDQDKRVQELDDFGISTGAFTGNLRDPVGTVSLNGKKKYRVLVQDRYRRGGERYQYVLTISKAQPDFYIAAIHSQNPGPGALTVWRGGATSLDVIIHQMAGYNGPITVTAEGLPAGVTAAPAVFRNTNRGTFVLRAADDAADFTGPIKLIATGERDGQPLRREVRAYTRVNTEANKSSSRPMQEMVIAVRNGAPYRLEWASDRVEVEAGGKAECKLRLTRRWADFKSDVTIQPLNFPGNFKLSNFAFKGSDAELPVTIEVQKNTPPGEHTIAVLGQGQAPFNKDPMAKDRPNTLVSLPSSAVTLIVKAPAPPAK